MQALHFIIKFLSLLNTRYILNLVIFIFTSFSVHMVQAVDLRPWGSGATPSCKGAVLNTKKLTPEQFKTVKELLWNVDLREVTPEQAGVLGSLLGTPDLEILTPEQAKVVKELFVRNADLKILTPKQIKTVEELDLKTLTPEAS